MKKKISCFLVIVMLFSIISPTMAAPILTVPEHIGEPVVASGALNVILEEDFSGYALGTLDINAHSAWAIPTGNLGSANPHVVNAPGRSGERALRVNQETFFLERLIPSLPTTGIIDIQYDIFMPSGTTDNRNVGIGLGRQNGVLASAAWNTWSGGRGLMSVRSSLFSGEGYVSDGATADVLNSILPQRRDIGSGSPSHGANLDVGIPAANIAAQRGRWTVECGRHESMWLPGEWITVRISHNLDNGGLSFFIDDGNGILAVDGFDGAGLRDITPSIDATNVQRPRTLYGGSGSAANEANPFTGVRINTRRGTSANNGSGNLYIANLIVAVDCDNEAGANPGNLPIILEEDFSGCMLGNLAIDGATWRSSDHSILGTNRNLAPSITPAPNRSGEQALRVVQQSLIIDRLIPNLPASGIIEIQYDIFVPRPSNEALGNNLANTGIGLIRDTSYDIGQFASVIWNTYSTSRRTMGPRVSRCANYHPPEQDANMHNVLPQQGPGGGIPEVRSTWTVPGEEQKLCGP